MTDLTTLLDVLSDELYMSGQPKASDLVSQAKAEINRLKKAIDEAVKREREACAKICDEQELSLTIDKDWPDQVAHRCAVAIRNRSSE